MSKTIPETSCFNHHFFRGELLNFGGYPNLKLEITNKKTAEKMPTFPNSSLWKFPFSMPLSQHNPQKRDQHWWSVGRDSTPRRGNGPNKTPTGRSQIAQNSGLQACRFGPESKPNPGFTNILIQLGTICGGLFPNIFFGDISATLTSFWNKFSTPAWKLKFRSLQLELFLRLV